MNLKLQKTLAGKVVKKSRKKVKINEDRIEDVKEAITKSDIRSLIDDGAISVETDKGISRFQAKQRASQKKKNRQRGDGHRKGKQTARENPKEKWMVKVRTQRAFLQQLRSRIDTKVFRNLILRVKGGYFRSLRHIKLHLDEHKLVKQNGKE